MKHPNAIVGGLSGLSGGAIVIYVLGLVGVHPSLYEAGIIFTLISSAALFVGRNGAVGTWKFVRQTFLYGKKAPAPPPVPPAPPAPPAA